MPARPHRVIVAGGGVAAVEAALALRARGPEVSVELVSAGADYVDRPQSLLAPFGAGGVRSVPLSQLAEQGVTVRRARIVAVDAAARLVHTSGGGERPFDALVVALGARARRPFERALTFRGPRDSEALRSLLADLDDGLVLGLAFVAPAGATWTLPLYELALQTAARARRMGLQVDLRLLTAEERPLAVFGRAASALAECLLAEAGIAAEFGVAPDGDALATDRVVALPLLEGLPIPGLPAGPRGFLPVDDHGRVTGVSGIYAAGDGIDAPVKQGGLAAQQADRVVDALLADRDGAQPPAAQPACLRAMLVTGDEVWYLQRAEGEADGRISRSPLWWPPSRIAGRYLAPFVGAFAGGS